MTPTLRHRNGILSSDNSSLQASAVAESYLTAEIASGTGTLTVKNIIGFGINQVLLIEDLGNDNAEIILTHASTVPSGTTVTLVGNTVKTHSAGSKVRVITYNQFELSHATTATGSKTVLTVATTANFNPVSSLGSGLVAVDPTTIVQSHESSEHSSGFYFARYKNSITSDFSPYTDAIEYGGWESNTVGYMIERALADLELTLSEKITRNDCYEWINECLKKKQGKLKRWPEHYSYNAVLGQISRGDNTTTMPTDAYDRETNKSLIALRIGTGKNLSYLSPGDFDNELNKAGGNGVATTQVTTEASAAQTTLEIDNSYDFADSGSVNVYISGTKYNITYTGVTRSATAGILTGVPASGDGSISVTIPVDTNVWQNEVEGTPVWFTVRNSAIEHWPLADASNDNTNLYGDYSKVATEVNSDGDEIDYQRFDTVQAYLTWRIKTKARNSGELNMEDGYYLLYREGLNDEIRTLPSNNKFRITPSINRIYKKSFNPRRADPSDNE